jgi:glutathione-independent formaldehyde dehydrogenase
VPYGDYNCLILPRGSEEKENDYVMLPTSSRPATTPPNWPACSPGDNVVIYGAGPVGLMAAYSATSRARAW